MNAFKNIIVALIMAAALATVSSAAFAKATGEEAVTAAVKNTISSLELAVSLLEQGGDNAAITKAIGDARQHQKEFRYEITERQRAKASNLLKVARSEFQNGNVQPAEQALREALALYLEMKAIYDKAH